MDPWKEYMAEILYIKPKPSTLWQKNKLQRFTLQKKDETPSEKAIAGSFVRNIHMYTSENALSMEKVEL